MVDVSYRLSCSIFFVLLGSHGSRFYGMVSLILEVSLFGHFTTLIFGGSIYDEKENESVCFCFEPNG